MSGQLPLAPANQAQAIGAWRERFQHNVNDGVTAADLPATKAPTTALKPPL